MKPIDLLTRLKTRFQFVRLTTELVGPRDKEVLRIEVRTHEHDKWRDVGSLIRLPHDVLSLNANPRAEPRDVAKVQEVLLAL